MVGRGRFGSTVTTAIRYSTVSNTNIAYANTLGLKAQPPGRGVTN